MKRLLLTLLLASIPPLLVACGGGGGGGLTGAAPVDPPAAVTTPAEAALASGTNAFTTNDLDTAVAQFNSVLADASAPADLRTKAREGLAFSLLRRGSTDEAIAALAALRDADADAGTAYATARLQKDGVVSIDDAVASLDAAVGGGSAFGGEAIATGITAVQSHAMLAVLLALRDGTGDASAAAAEAQEARAGAPDAPALSILAAYDLLAEP